MLKAKAESKAVIDLTDDQPAVSVVQVPQATIRPPVHAAQASNGPQASKFAASYTRAVTSSAPIRIPAAISVSKTPSAPTRQEISKLFPSSAKVTPLSSPSSVAAQHQSVVVPTGPAPTPVPVGAIFTKHVTPQAGVQNGVTPSRFASQTPNRPNIIGRTLHIPPGLTVKPVARPALVSSVVSSSSASHEEARESKVIDSGTVKSNTLRRT